MNNSYTQRVVVTFTTLPDRYTFLQNSVKSILNQTLHVDAIYAAIPKRCTRLNKEYPPVPKEITDICTVIVPDVDYGPITKIYGGLIAEADPETIIISCDDDVIYHPEFIQTIVECSKKSPNAAICGTGAIISRGLYLVSINTTLSQFRWWNWLIGFDLDRDNGRDVDVIFGVAGVLYRRKFFPSNDNLEKELFSLSLNNDALFHNDDIVISGFLSKNGIKRKVFHDIPSVVVNSTGKDALSADFLLNMKRLHESIQYSKTQGLFPTMEPLAIDETATGRAIILIFLLILIVAIIIIAFPTL